MSRERSEVRPCRAWEGLSVILSVMESQSFKQNRGVHKANVAWWLNAWTLQQEKLGLWSCLSYG